MSKGRGLGTANPMPQGTVGPKQVSKGNSKVMPVPSNHPTAKYLSGNGKKK